MLQKSWEMATILDFLELFRPYLNLSRSFTVHELESVLILSPGGEGLLGTLHIVSPGLMSSSMLSAFWPSPSLSIPQEPCKMCCIQCLLCKERKLLAGSPIWCQLFHFLCLSMLYTHHACM